MSWLLPWQWQPWNLTTGALEWGWGVGIGHAGGREKGPEAQKQEIATQSPSMASVSPPIKGVRKCSQDLPFLF